MNRVFAVLCLLVGVSGCSSDSVSFSIDNPTDAAISVNIDGTPHEIKPHAAKDLSLRAGLHSMESATTGSLKFVVYAKGRGGLINPTFSPYVTINEVYATNKTTAKAFRPGEKTIEIDGVAFKGPFVLSDELFIDKAWTYGVHEDFPETIRVGMDSKGNINSKLFSKDAFIRYVEAGEGQVGYFARNRKATPPPQRHFPPVTPLPTFKDAELEATAAPLKDLCARYQNATTADAQTALQKSYMPLVTEFLGVFARRASQVSIEDRETYNALILRVGNTLGQSVRVME